MNGVSPKELPDGPIYEAVHGHDWPRARQELAEKLARTCDATDSARDIKAVARELTAVMAQCEVDDRLSGGEESPLALILARADAARESA